MKRAITKLRHIALQTPFEYVPSRIAGFRSSLGRALYWISIAAMALFIAFLCYMFFDGKDVPTEALLAIKPAAYWDGQRMQGTDFSMGCTINASGKFTFPNDTFHSEIRWFQRFRYDQEHTGPSDFSIPSRPCKFRNTQHDLLGIGSCPSWVSTETDNITLSYPKLQGIYTLGVWAYVSAEVYIYSDNEVVMDDDVKSMGSQFFVSYMDNVLKNANWRKPLNQRFISISSSFDARAATRDKVDVVLIPRHISRGSPLMNTDALDRAQLETLVWYQMYTHVDDPQIKTVSRMHPNGSMIEMKEWLITTYTFRLSDRRIDISLNPQTTVWDLLSNIGGFIAITSIIFGLPAKLANKFVFERTLRSAIQEGLVSQDMLNDDLTLSIHDADKVVKNLETLLHDKHLSPGQKFKDVVTLITDEVAGQQDLAADLQRMREAKAAAEVGRHLGESDADMPPPRKLPPLRYVQSVYVRSNNSELTPRANGGLADRKGGPLPGLIRNITQNSRIAALPKVVENHAEPEARQGGQIRLGGADFNITHPGSLDVGRSPALATSGAYDLRQSPHSTEKGGASASASETGAAAAAAAASSSSTAPISGVGLIGIGGRVPASSAINRTSVAIQIEDGSST